MTNSSLANASIFSMYTLPLSRHRTCALIHSLENLAQRKSHIVNQKSTQHRQRLQLQWQNSGTQTNGKLTNDFSAHICVNRIDR